MPHLEQVLAIAAQLAGHPGRGLARGDAVQDQQDLTGAAVCPLQGGPGPGVEDPAAVAALVVQDRLPVAIVDPQALLATTPGAGQPIGVEQFDEFAVTRPLVQVVLQREIHRFGLRATRSISLKGKAFGRGRQEGEHGIGPMSQPG